MLLKDYGGYVISNLEYYRDEAYEASISNERQNRFGKTSLYQKLRRQLVLMVKNLKSVGNKKAIFETFEKNDCLHIGFPNLQVVDEDLGNRLPLYYPKFNFIKNKKTRGKLYRLAAKHQDIVVET